MTDSPASREALLSKLLRDISRSSVEELEKTSFKSFKSFKTMEATSIKDDIKCWKLTKLAFQL